MKTDTQALPPALEEIVELFEESSGAEKVELLLDFANRLPPLPESLRHPGEETESVPECMTPVSVFAETRDGRLSFYFIVPEESPTVRGLAAIMSEGVKDATPQEVLTIPGDFYERMGLEQVLTPQRLRGMAAILAHMKRLATSRLTGSAG
jgi:cysteine desulfuration protein SufE